ncbi:MAG: carboxypeptidase-like regulatory domain-containing protein [Phaeodactylibacter sp.]|nr:carboxypeptidase-like regulatory domain-containing protein [Phaeodactylibacter sp.]
MKLKLLITAGCCLMALYLSGQSAPLRGNVQDSETGEGIPFANLLLLSEKTGVAADANGTFELSISSLPAIIRVSAIGFQTDTITVDTISIQSIELKPIGEDLPMVEVLAQKKLKQISKKGRLPFSFAIWKDYLFVLSRKGTVGNAWIEVRSPDGILLYEQELALRKTRGLEVNCRNRLYLEANNEFINLGYTSEQIIPLEKMSYADYKSAYEDCQCSDEKTMYYQNVAFQGLLKRYFQASLETGELTNFRKIVQGQRLGNYFADLGKIKEGQAISNIGDISTEENDEIRTRQLNADFLERVFYNNPKENFLYLSSEALILFNHDDAQLEWFGPKGKQSQVIAAKYMLHEDWNGQVMQDIKTQSFYALLRNESGCQLAPIDLGTGQVADPVSLNIQYFDELVIYNNVAYIMGTPTVHSANGVKRLYTKPLW